MFTLFGVGPTAALAFAAGCVLARFHSECLVLLDKVTQDGVGDNHDGSLQVDICVSCCQHSHH